MSIPQVMQILEQIKSIHEKKNHDYSNQMNQFENFERASQLISWFAHDEDKTFVNQIGTKLARLSTLLNKKEGPKNESIEDSFLDLCTYCILWSAHYQVRRGSLIDERVAKVLSQSVISEAEWLKRNLK